MGDSKIYTKKGDKGVTSTCLGKMGKDDNLAEALGAIDELNSYIGWCRVQFISSNNQIPRSPGSKNRGSSAFSWDKQITKELKRVQTNLMTINSILAGSNKVFKNNETVHLEKLIDKLQGELPVLKNFIYPVGELQYARTLARRGERRVVGLPFFVKTTKGAPAIMKYLNRLSDALFVMGRWVNKQKGIEEEAWK